MEGTKKDKGDWIHLRISKPLKSNFVEAAKLEERDPPDMLRLLIKRFVEKKLKLEVVE